MKFYDRIAMGLGADFDTSSQTQDVRLRLWVEPVFARMQRRFPKFVPSYVEEEVEKMNNEKFMNFLNAVNIEISPTYTLSGGGGRTILTEKMAESYALGEDPRAADASDDRVYPVWDFTVRLCT
jgi:hypothetical protein